MTKHTKNQKQRRLRITVSFCEDEEENQRAFEHAVRTLLKDESYDDQASS